MKQDRTVNTAVRGYTHRELGFFRRVRLSSATQPVAEPHVGCGTYSPNPVGTSVSLQNPMYRYRHSSCAILIGDELQEKLGKSYSCYIPSKVTGCRDWTKCVVRSECPIESLLTCLPKIRKGINLEPTRAKKLQQGRNQVLSLCRLI